MRIIQDLFAYYIKSCRGARLEAADLDERGLRDDRRWMVVDEHGLFLTQFDRHPELARVVPRLTEDALVIRIDGDPSSRVAVPRSRWEDGERAAVTVWTHEGVGIDQGREAATFFSDFLRRPARLVRMPEDHVRVPSRRPAGVTSLLGFADAHPLLLATEASLAELNRHLPARHGPVPMARFRPNLVVAGTVEPWEEERWNRFAIDGVPFYGVKPRARCPVTQVDQRTGVRTGREPLRTLARIHRAGNAVLFGMNLVHGGLGRLRVGAEVRDIVWGERPET